MGACGGATQRQMRTSGNPARPGTAGSGSASPATQPRDSNDNDGDAGNGDDDLQIFDYGHAASRTEARLITTIVQRYYKAAAAENGAKACSSLVVPVAEAVPEELGQAPGQAYRRGQSCAVVISAFFKGEHKHIAAERRSLEITRVRVEGKTGLAILRLDGTSEPRKIALRREGGHWKIRELLDSGTP
jgi:hypothetical protein